MLLGYTYTSLICGYGYECSDFNKGNRNISIVVFSFVIKGTRQRMGMSQ